MVKNISIIILSIAVVLSLIWAYMERSGRLACQFGRDDESSERQGLIECKCADGSNHGMMSPERCQKGCAGLLRGSVCKGKDGCIGFKSSFGRCICQ